MLKGFRELAFRLILLCSGYKREKMIDQFSFDYQLLEKIKFKEESEKLSKDLDGSQKEIERLNNLVENLEKVPDDFEKAQTS